MFAQHKQAQETGEKKKSKSKLVSLSVAKERTFYAALDVVLILNKGWVPVQKAVFLFFFFFFTFRKWITHLVPEFDSAMDYMVPSVVP